MSTLDVASLDAVGNWKDLGPSADFGAVRLEADGRYVVGTSWRVASEYVPVRVHCPDVGDMCLVFEDGRWRRLVVDKNSDSYSAELVNLQVARELMDDLRPEDIQGAIANERTIAQAQRSHFVACLLAVAVAAAVNVLCYLPFGWNWSHLLLVPTLGLTVLVAMWMWWTRTKYVRLTTSYGDIDVFADHLLTATIAAWAKKEQKVHVSANEAVRV